MRNRRFKYQNSNVCERCDCKRSESVILHAHCSPNSSPLKIVTLHLVSQSARLEVSVENDSPSPRGFRRVTKTVASLPTTRQPHDCGSEAASESASCERRRARQRARKRRANFARTMKINGLKSTSSEEGFLAATFVFLRRPQPRWRQRGD